MDAYQRCTGVTGYLDALRHEAVQHGRGAIRHWSHAPDRVMGFKSPSGSWALDVAQIRKDIPTEGSQKVADVFFALVDGAMAPRASC